MLVWISAAACAFGYVVILLANSLYVIVSTHTTSDIGVMWFWFGLFAFLGWLLFVAPWITRLAWFKLFVDARWAWLTWSLLAAIAFLALTTWFMGAFAFQVLYMPAITGALDGLAFSWIVRWVRANRPGIRML
jgi:hypothetical protein